MATQLLIPLTVIACAMRGGEQTLNSRIHRRQFPEPDSRGFGNSRLWRISTIRAHDAELADRVLRILAVVEDNPSIAA